MVCAQHAPRISVRQNFTRIAMRQTYGARIRVQVGGLRGPQGLPGSGGDAVVAAKFAASSVGGHRIVRSVSATDVDYADASDIGHIDEVLGMTLNAASIGAAVQVISEGEVTESGWSWIPLVTIFLSSDGNMTQEPPDAPAAFSLSVGYATSPTSMRVRIGTPIEL